MASEARSSAVVVSGRLLGVGLSMAVALVVPGLLGAETYGIYAVWFYTLFLYGAVFDAGTTFVVQRYVPEQIARGGQGLDQLWRRVLWFKLALVVLGSGVTMLLVEPGPIWVMAAAAGWFAFSQLGAFVLYARQRLWAYVGFLDLRKALRLGLVVVLFLGFGELGLLLSIPLTEALCLLVMLPVLLRLPRGQGALPRSMLSLFAVAGMYWAATLVTTAAGRLPVPLASTLDMPAVVLGRVALVIEICYFALPEVLGGVAEAVLPSQVALRARHDELALRASLARTVRLTLLLAIPLVSVSIAVAPGLLDLLGRDYAPAAGALRFGLVGALLLSLERVPAAALAITEGSGRLLAARSARLFALVGLCLVLLAGGHGSLSAGIALTAAGAVALVGSCWLSRRHLPVSFPIHAWVRPLLASVLPAGALWWIAPHGLLSLTVGVAGALLAIGGLLLALGALDADERRALEQWLQRRRPQR